MIYFPLIFLEEKLGINVTFFCLKNVKKNIAFFHVRKTKSLSAYWLSFSNMEKYYIFVTFFKQKNVTFIPNFSSRKINGKYIIFHTFFQLNIPFSTRKKMGIK
jgi:hypothetical protein